MRVVNVAYNDGRSRQIPYQPEMGFYNELVNFYKAAIGQEPLAVTPELEYGDALTIFASLEAVKTGGAVAVDREVAYEPAY